MSFQSLGLSAELCRAVAEQQYTVPTPVQSKAIPAILNRCDIMASAHTGTGKTAGFTLPLLQLLNGQQYHRKGKAHIRALILVPTRELAMQVSESIRTYGRFLPLQSALIYGGVNIDNQIKSLNRGVDIVIATPGRLMDHLNRRSADISRVEFLVLDEADRMLDMGFINDVRKITGLMPKKRQTLLFSATLSDQIRALAGDLLVNPERIQIAQQYTAANNISQIIIPVDKTRKRDLLVHMYKTNRWNQVLVFTGMKHGASRLAEQLVKSGIEATAIHGDKSQGQRTTALGNFKNGKVKVLVATDVASRGLDIDLLPNVVNYELPREAENYIHRIGRTGRAGNRGASFSFVAADEMGLLKDIEQLLRQKLDKMIVPGFEPGARSQSVHQPKKSHVSAPPPHRHRSKNRSRSRAAAI